MAEDIMGRFYTCLNLKLIDKLIELSRLIDQAAPTKELQALFPQLINNIFAPSFSNGWNLKTVTCDTLKGNRLEFEALTAFLEPQGPMFRLCYKLMSDQQLKYDLPLNQLPPDLQMSLERGRCPQFYSDMLVVDPQTMNFVALALNPFDYYIFNFALHLVNNSQQQSTWENWNSAYFALACDYLMHFLPSDPNVPVLPLIPNYTGKVTMSAPLQTANRPLHTPSLLLIPDLCGMSSQHSSPQSQSRNEVWRSETVLQVFVDIWMSVDQFNPRDMDVFVDIWMSVDQFNPRDMDVSTMIPTGYSLARGVALRDRAAGLRRHLDECGPVQPSGHGCEYYDTNWLLPRTRCGSETVLQVFVDIWMSVDQFNPRDMDVSTMIPTGYSLARGAAQRPCCRSSSTSG
ncbi:mitochondrial-associated sphingomyelin phosphodiesterase domain-containing protein [Phthorimaea operculella]|nr:mitochondrial-associated sphingomyelin phosphodiesterase domain-containing protein [Phthorimaea operculella]